MPRPSRGLRATMSYTQSVMCRSHSQCCPSIKVVVRPASVDVGPTCCSPAVTLHQVARNSKSDNLALIGIQTPMNAVCSLDPTQIAWPPSSVQLLSHAELKHVCIQLLLAMLASVTVDTMELRESMLDSGISKAISAVLHSYSTTSTSAAGRQLMSAALDILSALLRPAPASGEDMAAAAAELKPLLKRVKPAALDAACTSLAAA